jgi:hypothetical protein
MESLIIMETNLRFRGKSDSREHLDQSPPSQGEREGALSSEHLNVLESSETTTEKAIIIPESPVTDIEKKLLTLMIPPTTPFNKAIWNLAIHLESSRIELERHVNNQEILLAPDIKDRRSVREQGYLERMFLRVVSKLLLPLLRVVLSHKQRLKLEEYHQEYDRLLQASGNLNKSTT